MFSFTKNTITQLLSNNTKWLEKQQTSINSAAAVIAMANILSILSGFIRTRVILSYFNEETVTAWTLAFQIPDMLFQLLVFGTLSASFIPIFLSVKRKNDEQTAFKMSSIVLNILMLIFAIASVIIYFYAEPLTLARVGDKLSSEQLSIVINLTKTMLLAQIFFTVSNVMTGILQSYKRFIVPSIAPIIYNFGIIAGVAIFHKTFGIYSAGIGVVFGALMHIIVQVPLAFKLGYKPTFSLNINFPGVKKLFLLSPARFLTIGVSHVQTLALGYFATSIGQLSFLYISYATYLSVFPVRLFGVPLSQAALPFLSQQSGKENLEKFRDLILQSLNQISFLAMPTSVLLLILRVPIVRLAFGTDNFSWHSTITTGKILAILAISITAQAMVQLLIRGFHALKDTRTPLIISVIFTAFYLVGSFAVVNYTNFGILGLAVISCVSFLVELLMYIIIFNKFMPNFISKSLLVPQLKILSASFFMAIFLYLPFRIFDELIFNTTKTIELIALTLTTGTIGMLVYIYFAAIFEIKELKLVNKAIRSFGQKWKSDENRTQEFLIETSVDDDLV
ncbi:MAG: murein biosynthesis integral membrane protein MurJ [Candidatus Pacebacteria bacterium CG11_big_fil_rev_8_21_14_0_20_34_55]|nr:murein biosynthesis integral membrane protein MurJ [Candidatus Pacearchaeota archaeon]NCQ65588.1 murein biosynthesis integral membrane protein MurJ [Candidatus Paceibacterota bacterium]NCS86575.1 murein biosynthesis integral membrane protein MurJ [Candidatus Paceibacterota bacterium]PIQ80733.1 MAG: murein biosynthesis integral membrane protein MurJ [Candidatus Pacebacteria bacterium CG11_big_fil_rev_8_21_14_0_20_34_55]PJC43419.1 MAG: murein biosynthesis integral membrane protein MurJ [Candid